MLIAEAIAGRTSGYGLVAMTNAKGREFDPHYPYFVMDFLTESRKQSAQRKDPGRLSWSQQPSRRFRRPGVWKHLLASSMPQSCRLSTSLSCRVQALAHHNMSNAAIAQLGERQTEDLKVPGSILGLGICLWGLCSWVRIPQVLFALQALQTATLGCTNSRSRLPRPGIEPRTFRSSV